MYIRKIVIKNYGPIEHLDYSFPFTEVNKPKPVILIGQNGVGKTLLLSNILHSIIEMKRSKYREISEVSGNNFYRVGSLNYIKTGFNALYEQLIFDDDIKYTELMTNNYDYLKNNWNPSEYPDVDLLNNELQNNGFFYNTTPPENNVFEKEIFLYFPVERYYVPTWENKNNDKLSYITDNENYIGQSNSGIISYNMLNDINSWILDVLVDEMLYETNGYLVGQNKETINPIYKGKNNNIHSAINKVLTIIFKYKSYVFTRVGVSPKNNLHRQINIIGKKNNNEEEVIVPRFTNLSSGEVMLFGMMASILKEYDRISDMGTLDFSQIKGIVLIDEIDAHLHSDLMRYALPELFNEFPNIQFIVTSHSPFFLLGMKEKFGSNCQFLTMPNGIILDNVEFFSEIKNCFSLVDDTYKAVLSKYESILKIEKNTNKPLIITEGKTDWKHLKTALRKLKEIGKFQDLEINFLEYDTVLGDTQLDTLLRNLCRVPRNNIVVGIFDNDTSTGKRYTNIKIFENNVYGFSLFDTQGYSNEISVELLYRREDLYKTNEEGRRLFLTDEFSNHSHRLINNHNINSTNTTISDAHNRGIIKIVDSLVYDDKDNNISLSKEEFAELVSKEISPYNNMDFSGFETIFETIVKIIKREI